MKRKHYRSEGHVTVCMARMRAGAIGDFKRWYFKENGDVLPDDMYAMFERGFNSGVKALKAHYRSGIGD